MGRTITPTFRVEYVMFGNIGITSSAWYTRHEGHPDDENLRRHVEKLEDSSKPGGCNAHCGPMVVASAKIIRQKTDEVVANYKGPAFVVG